MGLRRNKKLKTRLAGSPNLLVGAWRRRGCRRKRLLRRWGPGGKRSRDTPPTPPPPPRLCFGAGEGFSPSADPTLNPKPKLYLLTPPFRRMVSSQPPSTSYVVLSPRMRVGRFGVLKGLGFGAFGV